MLTRREHGTLLLIIVALISGCSHRETPIAPAEPTLAAQAEAVRRGDSDTIRLNHTPVDDAQLAALDGLEDKLRRINLSHTTITDAGLAKITRMHSLVQLRLAGPKLTDDGLASLPNLKQLRYLHLIAAPITDAGLKHLEGLTHLESLYLDGIQATDAGIEALVRALPKVHLHVDGGHHHVDPQADEHEHSGG